MPSTVQFHRVFKAPVSRVFKAFTQADAMCKWLPPAGYTCRVHNLDARQGGSFRMSFTEFDSGGEMFFGGEYLDFIPNKLLRYTDRFDDPNLAGEIIVTVHFNEVMCGTEIAVTQAGIPDIIPKEMCELGWQDSLVQLQQFVEVLNFQPPLSAA
jgi:uncharacterized protein YndB with AHSA1/START domain